MNKTQFNKKLERINNKIEDDFTEVAHNLKWIEDHTNDSTLQDWVEDKRERLSKYRDEFEKPTAVFRRNDKSFDERYASLEKYAQILTKFNSNVENSIQNLKASGDLPQYSHKIEDQSFCTIL